MSVIFSLAGSLRFLLATNRRFFVMFALADFLLDAGFRAAALESSQRAVKRFISPISLKLFHYILRMYASSMKNFKISVRD